MSRHLILALGLALVAAATALLLADVGVFESPTHWLFARYAGESLWKESPTTVWPVFDEYLSDCGHLNTASTNNNNDDGPTWRADCPSG